MGVQRVTEPWEQEGPQPIPTPLLRDPRGPTRRGSTACLSWLLAHTWAFPSPQTPSWFAAGCGRTGGWGPPVPSCQERPGGKEAPGGSWGLLVEAGRVMFLPHV